MSDVPPERAPDFEPGEHAAASGFHATGAGVRLRLSPLEVTLLTGLVGQMDELYEPPPVDDPLEALVGLRGCAPPPPDDPAVARLLPDAYPQDPAASADFRRRTSDDLLVRKREAARRVLTAIPAPYEPAFLDEQAAQDWLTTLNDLRLVLGTRLGIVTAADADAVASMPADDPRRGELALYGLLAELLAELVQALSPGGGDDDEGR
jgi:hypothetical protein